MREGYVKHLVGKRRGGFQAQVQRHIGGKIMASLGTTSSSVWLVCGRWGYYSTR